MLSCGDKVVSRALGGGCGENGGGYLKKAVRRHRLTQCGNDIAAQDDIVLDGGIAQIEVAVFQALGFVRLAAAVYLKGQLVIAAFAENLYPFGDYLDIAGRLLGVLARALAHRTLDGYGGLLIHALDDCHHRFILDDDLRRAVKVADNDERKVAADLADILHPADDFYLFAHIFNAKLVAGMCTHLCHGHDLSLPYLLFLDYRAGVSLRDGGGYLLCRLCECKLFLFARQHILDGDDVLLYLVLAHKDDKGD